MYGYVGVSIRFNSVPGRSVSEILYLVGGICGHQDGGGGFGVGVVDVGTVDLVVVVSTPIVCFL